MSEAMRILIVDDNESVARVLEEILTREGHTVDVASSGHGAEGFLLNQEYDVAVIDVILPDTSGVELCQLVRERDPDRKMKLVLMSGYGTDRMREMGTEAGADLFLPKPFTRQDILGLLDA